ncbi:hypothetical protein IFM89_008224 [Coptis chinensis]|uniref:Uncharacterized protein n=1 Tax=Coptis chinensis TaxID=261450 RepID=A0A835IA36_9MAGN|nr:hypothetical protein IFM89_008224 [Coptis chinensis]
MRGRKCIQTKRPTGKKRTLHTVCAWSKASAWESSPLFADTDWKRIVVPDADLDSGSCKAMELLDHLESVLTNEPVAVKKGHHIVEVVKMLQGLASASCQKPIKI